MKTNKQYRVTIYPSSALESVDCRPTDDKEIAEIREKCEDEDAGELLNAFAFDTFAQAQEFYSPNDRMVIEDVSTGEVVFDGELSILPDECVIKEPFPRVDELPQGCNSRLWYEVRNNVNCGSTTFEAESFDELKLKLFCGEVVEVDVNGCRRSDVYWKICYDDREIVVYDWEYTGGMALSFVLEKNGESEVLYNDSGLW